MNASAILWIVAAYLLGTLPFGLWISWSRGIDIRRHGSGNIGATNVFRVVGKKWGILVFALDGLKGYLAVTLPAAAGHPAGGLRVALAVSAVLGHTFPVWLGFRGGKGVATSLGAFLGVSFLPTALAFLAWLAVFFSFRIISVASLAAASLFPVISFFTVRRDPIFPYLMPLSALLAAFIFYTHRANLRRLLKGEEKRLF